MAFARNGVSIDYLSIGCNRYSNAADCTPEDLVAFGAGKLVALWQLAGDKRGVYRTLPGHSSQVTAVKILRALDAEGRIYGSGLLSGDAAGQVIVWRCVNGDWKATAHLQGHNASISALGVLAEGSLSCFRGQENDLVITGASDGCLGVWEVSRHGEYAERVQLLNLKGRYPLDIAVACLAHADALIMAVACTDRRLQLWSRQRSGFEYRLSLEGHEDWIRSLAFVTDIPDDTDQLPRTILASGSQDGYIRLWTISELAGAVGAVKGATDVDILNSDLFDAFEKSLVDANGGQLSTKAHILTFSTEYGTQATHKFSVTFDALLVGHEGWITGLHWHPPLSSPDPSRKSPRQRQPLILLSAASDNSMIMWSQDQASSIWLNRQRFGDIVGKGMGFFGALWSSKGLDVLAHGWNGSFHRWRRPEEADEHAGWNAAIAVTGHGQPVRDVAWDPRGDYFLSFSSDQTTRIHGPWYQIKSDRNDTSAIWHELARPQIHGYDLVTGAFLDPLRFVSAADEKVARVFDAPKTFMYTLQDAGLLDQSSEVSSRPSAATVPPLGLSNKELTQEDTAVSPEDLRPRNRPPVESELASTTLWPEIEKLFGHGYELFALATSPGAQFVATSCKSTTSEHAVVRIYEASSWKPFGSPLAGHSLTITRIAFSPSGKFVLSVSRDRSWRLYEYSPNGYKAMASEKAHARIIWDCAWSSTDDLFVTAARDKTVKVWRNESSTWRSIATIKLAESANAVDLLRLDSTPPKLYLAVGLETGEIELYTAAEADPAKWKKDRVIGSDLAHVDQIHRIRWCPKSRKAGSRTLASCSEDGSIRVLDIELQ